MEQQRQRLLSDLDLNSDFYRHFPSFPPPPRLPPSANCNDASFAEPRHMGQIVRQIWEGVGWGGELGGSSIVQFRAGVI